MRHLLPVLLLSFVVSAHCVRADIIIGGATLNGDFNADTSGIDQREFLDTPDWFNLTGNQNIQATRSNLSFDASRNAVVNMTGERLFGSDTGYTIQDGDVFDVSYVWRDAFNWNLALDQIQVSLFTTADDVITGVRTDLVVDLSGPSVNDVSYDPVDHNGIYTAGAGDAGKRLFVEFTGLAGDAGDTNGFARLDNFVLEVTAIPEPASIALAGLGLALLARFRRWP